jgi:NADH-quinone oxidoreductase subunit L
MSQIGYMIMGVSAGAYSGALFLLMAHAFFKALLFMAAGSLIAAMAGNQSLDRMSGFRRALPFTFGCFVIGGMALSGLPPFSGWFSKDDILAYLNHRGGGFEVMGIAGYMGAILTAIYTFRMIFRAFFGEPCPEAKELEEGHIAHAEVPTNPQTGEVEDTDVGFPGPEHHIAEREWPMKIAMGTLALLATVGGFLQIPGVDDAIRRFLAPTFTGSALAAAEPSNGADWIGLVIGAAIAVAGVAVAYRVWVLAPGTAARVRERFAPLYRLFVNKWYFDELIDLTIVRPVAWFGQVQDTVLDRTLVVNVITGGAVTAVGAVSAAVRRAQTGFVRYYVALMLLGISGVLIYFLASAS